MNTKLFALALVFVSGTSMAFAEPQSGEPVLKGPTVTDGGVPGSRRPFGDGQSGDNKQRLADRPIPQMEFMRAVNILRAEKTPENLRLTDEQQDRIREINQKFEQSMRDFREAHKDEFEAMRGQFGDRGRPPRKGGQPGDGPDGPPPRQPAAQAEGEAMAPAQPPKPDAAARQRFEELRAQAPSPKDAQAQVFSVLTAEQRPLVQERLEAIKKEMAERGMEGKAREEVRRRIQKQNGPDGKFDPNNLPPKLKERLDNMSPEDRERAMQRMRERSGQDGRRGPRSPEALPADLQETWDSMTPEERRFLIQKLREKAREEGTDMPPPRKRGRAEAPPKDD